ncbi:alpha/beta hydrolase family protein [Nitratireductor sp.]|uniref:alpha/beta hydrolase family protein n=1 Tax=Nitratireductor sp. TaxID=1872084 RepID=UPI0025F22ED5|nr:alpha/beta fold hydrolase [Nitratireductor sp.]
MKEKRPSRRIVCWFIGPVAALLVLGAIFVLMEEDRLDRRKISFTHAGNTLQGLLLLPAGTDKPSACMIFVHGSGDMPRDAHGYYEAFWRLFANKGWCSMSWDKPGTGGSDGDWRLQSMEDRADEVSAAIDFLRQNLGLENGPVGLIGFSQAGWVLPKVVNRRDDIAFMIPVSGAINWMKQSRYSGRKRMEAEGMSEQEIAAEQRTNDAINALIQSGTSYETYLKHISENSSAQPMSEAFWGFAKRNWRTDVRADLRKIDVPVLALFGTHDAYVDPIESARTYRAELSRSAAPVFEIRIFDHADHGMLATDEVKPTHQGLDAWLMLLRIWFGGDSVFAEGVLECLAEWMDRLEQTSMSIVAERMFVETHIAEPTVEAFHRATIRHDFLGTGVCSVARPGKPGAAGSRATRSPESELSTTLIRHSRLKSSTKHRMRKRRPSTGASETKFRGHLWFGS